MAINDQKYANEFNAAAGQMNQQYQNALGGLIGAGSGLLGGGQAMNPRAQKTDEARRTVQLAIQSGHVSVEDLQAALEITGEGHGQIYDLGYALRLLLTAEIERRKGNV